MNRAQKEAFVSKLAEDVGNAQAFALMAFSGLTVEKMTAFRLGLRKNNVRVRVVKNTLARKVFAATPHQDIAKSLTGPTLIAYSSGDAVLAAKTVSEWLKKEGFELKFKGAVALGESLTPQRLEALARLPGREELFVSFLWALKSSPTKFLYALQDAPRKLGYAIHALKEKKEKESA